VRTSSSCAPSGRPDTSSRRFPGRSSAGVLGSRTAGALLAAGAAAYLVLFVVSARRALGLDRALAWIPVLRVLVDVAKVHGFAEGVLRSWSRMKH
jgi:hypothetical protein